MSHAPNDPLNREAASFHNYMGKACDHLACWRGTVARVAAHVPVVTGEFSEDNFDERTCHEKASTFDTRYMGWADSAGVSYLAWGWIVESKAERAADGCSAFYLIDDYTHHTPAKPNGVAVYGHLRALAKRAEPPVRLKAFTASVRSTDRSVGFRLRAVQKSSGALSAKTVHKYGATKRKRHKVSLGAVHLALKAGKAKTVVLKLSRPSRQLLARRHSLKVRITITLTAPRHRRTVTHRTVTLKSR
jgi:hypothetical protein